MAFEPFGSPTKEAEQQERPAGRLRGFAISCAMLFLLLGVSTDGLWLSDLEGFGRGHQNVQWTAQWFGEMWGGMCVLFVKA